MTGGLGWQYDTFSEVRDVLDKGGARLATAREYADWLEGHLWNRWGSQDFDFTAGKAEEQVYILTKDTGLPPLTGALALKIIVPEGIRVNLTGGSLGHSSLYFMEDYSAQMGQDHKVLIYSDALDVMGKEGYYAEDFIYAKPRPQEEFNRKVVRPNAAKVEEAARHGTTRQMAVKVAKFRQKQP